jgi:hypothetical protein
MYVINISLFDNAQEIELRVKNAKPEDQGHLRSALRYLYERNGPINLPEIRKNTSLPYLTEAEQIVIKWLFIRTNGTLRKTYGHRALRSARNMFISRCKSVKFRSHR